MRLLTNHKKRMKRKTTAIALLLLIASGVLLFSGCGGIGSSPDESGQSPAAEESEPEDSSAQSSEENNILQVDPIAPKEIQGEKVDFVTHSGTLTRGAKKTTYDFATPREGIYRFDFSDIPNEQDLCLEVTDPDGKVVNNPTTGWLDQPKTAYCSNSVGTTLNTENLDIKKKHTLSLWYDEYAEYESIPFKLTIGQPKNPVDITGATDVNDSMEFAEQDNLYRFTAPRDGTYRFEAAEIRDEQDLRFNVYNDLGEELEEEFCYNGDGITMELSEGKTYDIHVRAEETISPYTFKIGTQKPAEDISAYAGVNDSVEFTEQDNIYKYTPQSAGEMSFSVSELRDDSEVQITVFNRLGEEVAAESGGNGEYVTVEDTKAKETYEVHVSQYKGYSPYTLSVQQMQ